MRPPWQWFRQPPAQPAQPAPQLKSVLGLGDALSSVLTLTGDVSTAAAALYLYANSTAVSVPINFIADALLDIEPVIKTGDTFETDHEVLDFLKHPSPDYTGTLFREVLAKDHLITGEAFFVAGGLLTRAPLWLQPISPRNVDPQPDAYGQAAVWHVTGHAQPGHFVRTIEQGRLRLVDGNLRELKQIRSYSTKDNSLLHGQSLLEPAAAEARLHIQGNTHNESLLRNAGRGSLVFHYRQDMDPETYKAVCEDIRQKYGGAGAAGKIVISAGEQLELHELGVTNRDMDYAKLHQIVQVAVANQYKVPLPLITTSAATLDNYTMALRALYDYAVLPLVRRIYGGLGDFLLPRFKLNPRQVSISYDPDKIPALVLRRNTELLTRSQLGIESPDELREAIGRDPLPNGVGALPLVQASMVPIGTDLMATQLGDDEL
jgi:HK97 family phage portal protein